MTDADSYPGHAALHLVFLAAWGERAWQDNAAAELAE